jgi:Tol biopolymer transport system component
MLDLRTPTGLRGAVMVAAAALASCTSTPSMRAPAPATSVHTAAQVTAAPDPGTGGAIDVSALKGRIVFSAGPAHGEDVYVVNADGSGLRRLTADPSADFDPALSPDGTRIVYRHQGESSETSDVYVMNDDGSDPHNVSSHDAADWGPGWSPDGKRVLWNCQRDLSYGFRACTANPDGTRLKIVPGDVYVEYPAWSPDGTRIAFMSQEPGASGDDPDYNIFVMKADGTGITRLTDAPGSDGFPSWSPDGTRIAFSSTRDDCRHATAPDCRSTGDIGPHHEVWIMDANGSNQHRLSGTFGQFSSWSPDGSAIVFSPGLKVIRPDGTGQVSIAVDGVGGDIEFANWGT